MPTNSSQALNKLFFSPLLLDVINVHSELSRKKYLVVLMRNVGKYIKLNSHHMLEITTDQGNSIGHGRLPAACEDLGKVRAYFKKKYRHAWN